MEQNKVGEHVIFSLQDTFVNLKRELELLNEEFHSALILLRSAESKVNRKLEQLGQVAAFLDANIPTGDYQEQVRTVQDKVMNDEI